MGNDGIIFNIQRYSIHDGPGIRTTVFLKGCPLKCRWCSNPESINPYPEIFLRKDKCDQCGKCLDVCVPKAITISNDIIRINRNLCNLCMKCEEICLLGVINPIGKKVTVQEVVDEVLQDELFYNNSGGGVTISGGEPLYQLNFTLNLLKKFKEKSLHTTIDTSGYAKWEEFEKVLEYTDLILFDIKHLHPKKHQEATGVTNELILKNFERCLEKGMRIWVRLPTIPDFNDSIQYFNELGNFLSEKAIEKVSILQYHEYGKHKYKYLDRNYPISDAKFYNNEQLQNYKKIMESYNLKVTIDY